jgi:metallo-beta-lactamase family protein
MNVKFCGAAREVTGSSHLITLSDGYKILLDCGMYQGGDEEMENFNREWLFKPSEIDCLILSHAHIDHTGRVPKLIKDGFKGKIICTHATRSLCSIMLLDSASIQERDAFYHNKYSQRKIEPLYRTEDAKRALNHFVGIGYDHWFDIKEGVRLLFRDAGHILGSANVTLELQENGETRRFGFTGDIGRPERPILRNPQPMPEVDYLISESTYGSKEHTAAPREYEKLLGIIQEVCVQNKGKLIIPAFSVGRTQEIVYMMDRMSKEGLLPNNIPVYVDSPLAVNATIVFGNHPECFDDELNQYLRTDSNPFGFNSLHYVHDVATSKSINHSKKSCIVISASGMMNAGRVKHHLFNSIENHRNGILIVGYCSPNTPGGKLRAGAKSLTLFGHRVRVNAKLYTMDSFSAHGDRSEMEEFLRNQKEGLQKLFLVHGTLDRQQAFREYLEDLGYKNIEIPSLGQEFEL